MSITTVPIARDNNNTRSISPPIVAAVMVVMVVVVFYIELSHFNIWRACGFIDGL
jgi:hypothetical protein